MSRCCGCGTLVEAAASRSSSGESLTLRTGCMTSIGLGTFLSGSVAPFASFPGGYRRGNFCTGLRDLPALPPFGVFGDSFRDPYISSLGL